ncbi:MAG: prepilin-type N-terminal cleavage/methylation domain-containing protein [Acinetobacter populi]|jgi:type IV pilus assembly protein PilE|uniref:type IV pilin protein n=1 Tax=Acinetobacter populi TaxID=1582270 RepID=UPI0023522BE1|nr:prepilin-type N-terminal cleavage/methylation domain-containing protein [Acinetobacter populi]MCH4247920.1 prepilin-type N-terminal cleavage/methylation domain-containing protein [Acinetobacter populi]
MYLTDHKGFTLIELMVTVVIIAIFAVIAIPSYQSFIAKSKRSKAQSEMQVIAERLENYRGKQLNYAGYIPEHQNSGVKGVVNIPYGSSSTDFDYQIHVVDSTYQYDQDDQIKENPKTQSLEDATIGQGWKMVAMPNQTKSSALRNAGFLLLDSRGVRCITEESLTTVSDDCGLNSRDW